MIETLLKELTDAIKANTEAVKQASTPAETAPATAAPKAPAAPPVETARATAAPKAPAAPPVETAPATIPAEPPAMTVEELNAALVQEFHRLGSRENIYKTIMAMGVTSISELKPAQYKELLDKVQAL